MKHFWASFRSPPRCRNGLDRGSQLSLFNTGIGHQDGHLATKFLPGEVGVLKFRIADMSAKYEKNIGTRGSCISFEATRALFGYILSILQGLVSFVPIVLLYRISLFLCYLENK